MADTATTTTGCEDNTSYHMDQSLVELTKGEGFWVCDLLELQRTTFPILQTERVLLHINVRQSMIE
jgi:hypothetical protein